MRIFSYIGIIICMVILIGVLISSIKRKISGENINIYEIIISVISIVISIILWFLPNGDTEKPTDDESTSNVASIDIATSTSDYNNNSESFITDLIETTTASQKENTTDSVTIDNDDKKQKVLQQVSQYESKSDFVGGIKYINSLPSELLNDPDITSKLNHFKGCYRELILSDAEKAFNSSGYAAAVNILNEAVSILPNDDTINEKIEYYQSYAPTPIKSIVMKNSSSSYNFSSTEYDPRGKMYTNVIRLDSSAINGIGYRGILELYAEKKYSTFKCTFVPEADYSTNSGAGAYIEIYKDGILSYTSELITYKTTGIDVSLDIRNTEYIKIKIINVNPNYPYMAHADTLLCDAYVIK